MVVLISDRQKDVSLDYKIIEDICFFVMDELDIKGELSLSFVTEEESCQLNKQYRKKEKAAEVLSFPMDEANILGDVVIAPIITQKKAETENENFSERLSSMLTHGILHLAGLSHEDEKTLEEMADSEVQILKGLKGRGLI